MLGKPNLLHKAQVGLNDLVGGPSAEHLQYQCQKPLHDQRVALGMKVEPSLTVFSLQPYPALTTLNDILWSLVHFIKRFKGIALLNDVGVLIHPVAVDTKLVYNLLLYLVYRLHYFIVFSRETFTPSAGKLPGTVSRPIFLLSGGANLAISSSVSLGEKFSYSQADQLGQGVQPNGRFVYPSGGFVINHLHHGL